MKKHWSLIKWNDFTTKQKMWFCLLCICLSITLILACLAPSGIMYVPDWLIMIIAAGSAVVLCKFLQLTPWAALGFGDSLDEDNDAVDSEADVDI